MPVGLFLYFLYRVEQNRLSSLEESMLGGKLREGGAGGFVQLLRHPHFSSQYGLDGKHIVALLCAHILRHIVSRMSGVSEG